MNCLEFACNELDITKDLLWSRRRFTDVVAKRWMIICFMYELGMNYTQIGRKINRDHQAVMYAVKNAPAHAWDVAEELLHRYEVLVRPTRKIPNYKTSTVEVIYA